jgi:tetratricopeptide (TPR) repeat protein
MAADKKTLLREALKQVQAGKIDKAVETYKAAVKLDPRDATVHNLLGDLYVRRGKKKDATAEYLEASALYEKDGFALRSIAICQKVINLDPGQMAVRLKLADLYAGQKLTAEARAQYLQVAEFHDRKGDVAAALEIFRKLADLEPGNLPARVKVAGMFEKQTFPEKAAEEYVRAAKGYLDRKETDAAVQLYERAFKLAPSNLEARVRLADHHAQRQEWPVVVGLLETPVATGAADTRLRLLYAEALTRVDRPGEAVKVLEEVQAREPDSAPANLALGRACLKAGAVERGISAFGRCVSAYLDGNQLEPAESLLREMADAAPDDENIARRLLEVSRKRGDQAAVAAATERLQRFQPAAPAAPAPPAPAAPAEPQPPAPCPPAGRETVEIDLEKEDLASLAGAAEEEELVLEIEEAEAPEPEPAGVAPAPPPVEPLAAERETGVDLVDQLAEVPVAAPEPERAPEPEPGPAFEPKLELEPSQGPAAGSDLELEAEPLPESAPEPLPEPLAAESAPSPALGSPPEPSPSEPATAEPPAPEGAAERFPGFEEILEPLAESLPPEPVPEPQPAPAPDAPGREDLAKTGAAAKELEEFLAVADSYLRRGLVDEAESLYGKLRRLAPGHGPIADQLRKIEELRASEPAPPPLPELPAVSAGGSAEFKDFLGELRQEFDARSVVPPPPAHPKLEAGLSEVFQEFQRSVKSQLGDEDFETHYNLGIAYKEMGLVDEAVAEFSLAEKSPERRLKALIMIALCLRETGRFDEAAAKLRTGVSLAAEGSEEQKGFLYDLAALHEQAGRTDEAREALGRLLAIDPGYRDVAARLGAAPPAPPAADVQRRKKSKVSYL